MLVSTTAQPQTSKVDAGTASCLPCPRDPILDWSSLAIVDALAISSIESLAHTVLITSGRATPLSGPKSLSNVLAKYIAAARFGEGMGTVASRIRNLWRKNT
jgi:hypothetical protein